MRHEFKPFVQDGVLFGADEQVAALVKKICGENKGNWEQYTALGVIRDEVLLGGVVFHNYRPQAGDVEITAGFVSPKWCTARTLGRILRYAIDWLECTRCTARTAASNDRARDFLERLGFKVEGHQRRAYDGREDYVLYGVLRHEGRWRENL